MRAGAVLLAALCPVALAVRLAKDVLSEDAQIAEEAKKMHESSKEPSMANQCGIYSTERIMCKEPAIKPRHTVAAVMSTYRENLHWIDEMPWSDNLTVYVHDRAGKQSFHSKVAAGFWSQSHAMTNVEFAEESEAEIKLFNARRSHPIQFKTVPTNGDEAATFLSWIMENYNNLPDVTFFLQGHRCSEAAEFDMSIALPHIRNCFTPDKGYLNINNFYNRDYEPECKTTDVPIGIPRPGYKPSKFVETWNTLFFKEFGAVPTKICWDGEYSQFAVSRAVIRRHPLAFYESLYQGVMDGQTNMFRFWRTIFAKEGGLSWELEPESDIFGRLVHRNKDGFSQDRFDTSNYINPRLEQAAKAYRKKHRS